MGDIVPLYPDSLRKGGWFVEVSSAGRLFMNEFGRRRGLVFPEIILHALSLLKLADDMDATEKLAVMDDVGQTYVEVELPWRTEEDE